MVDVDVERNCEMILYDVVQGAFKMMERLNIKKERVMDLEKAMETGDTNGDGILDFEEWRTSMKTYVLFTAKFI